MVSAAAGWLLGAGASLPVRAAGGAGTSTRISQEGPSMHGQRQRYKLKVTIASPQRLRNVPYGVELDFDRLLKDKRDEGHFDRFSVLVRKVNPKTGALEEVHFNLSDDFLIGNKGKVNWLIEDTTEREYVIFYDVREPGPWPPPAYIGLVGNGDCLRFNDGKLHPLHVGMAANAVAVDWDGDGRTEIITSQIYGHTWKSPWFPIRMFRNEGTDDAPFYGEGIPLQALEDGELKFIRAAYGFEMYDWNADGLPDLVTFPYFGHELRFYRNTGDKDATGMPVLELAGIVPLTKDEKQYHCMRLVDWFGDGRLCVFMGYNMEGEVERGEPLWFPSTQEERDSAQWPRWYYKSYMDFYENLAAPGALPRLSEPVLLRDIKGEVITSFASTSLELVDLDHTGRLDLMVQWGSPDFDKGYTALRYFRNVGARGELKFEDAGLVPGIQDRTSLYVRWVATPPFKGLFAHPGSAGGKIRYYELTGRDESGLPAFADRGFLMQRNAYLSAYSGYAQGHLCDWDEDGDWDLVTGCETGWVTRIENIGTQRRPAFAAPKHFTLNGEPLELLNGPFDDPGSLMEANIGQTAPAYLDWDADGVLDLVVLIGRRLLFYRNLGTSAQPNLAAPVEIRAEDGSRVISHRNKPALVDWDGDGLIDVIGHSEDQARLLLFRRCRDPHTGELRLRAGETLHHADGTVVAPSAWHHYCKYYNVADWKGKGSFDIFVGVSDQILYLENVGSNQAPAFLPPVRMAADGVPITIGHHVSTPLPVDWDRSGRLDLFVSGESGLFHLFRRNYLEGAHRRIRCRIGAR